VNLSDYEYFRTENGVLYCGDCMEIMPMLEPVDLVLTDPPYGLNKKVQCGGWSSGKEKYDDMLIWDIIPDWAVFNAIFKLSEDQIIFGGNYFTDFLPVSRCWLVWIKPKMPSMSEVDVAWTSFDKPSKPFYCPRVNPSTHPTQKPTKLIVDIISAYSGPTVTILDPFFGSGTTGVACERLGRKWLGIEISEKYCEVAAKRIQAEANQLKMF